MIDKGDMQKVMNQHQKNQFAQDVPFMKGDTKSEDDKSDGTGVFDPGNVHSQVPLTFLTSAASRLLSALSPLSSPLERALPFLSLAFALAMPSWHQSFYLLATPPNMLFCTKPCTPLTHRSACNRC